MIIRPIQDSDYPALYAMATASGHGFTSLPADQQLLQQRIEKSIDSFQQDVNQAGNEHYLFVLVDPQTNKAVGISGIEASVGLDAPFYHYHRSKVVHCSRVLNIYNTVETLHLCNDYTGCSELCSLFLLPEYRKQNNGQLLSRARFLFMAEFANRFAAKVIAELRGISDQNGRSPFWHWLEQHFFSLDFPTADYLTGIGNKVFIAELMPKFPIYVNLLSDAAQAAIGKVHKNTLPALNMLTKEGFEQTNYIDIFDAGPTVEAKLANINSITNSKRYKVHAIESNWRNQTCPASFIIANNQLKNFRATLSHEIRLDEANKAIISATLAKQLQLSQGDHLRLVANY